ncbi:MAG: UvrD-helicase domain-containing protein, partial [Spirochaetota bacterium]
QDNLALKEFIYLNGFETVWKDFFSSLAAHYFHISDRKDFNRICEKQFTLLKARLKTGMELLTDVSNKICSLDPKAGESIRKAQIALGSLPNLLELLKEKRYEEIARQLEAITIQRPGTVKLEDLVRLKEYLAVLIPERETLLNILDTLENEDLIHGMFQLCGDFQDHILEKKRNAGVLSFQDVQEMAVAIILENKNLRSYYKKRFSHILIDEFQDNNLLQKRLLYLLAEKKGEEKDDFPQADDLEKGKLFFVGDEKQSIYRFRGADVSVFKKLKSEISETGGRHISLPVNYRSNPGLIDFFNTLFPPIMNNAGEAYEAGFEALVAEETPHSIKPVIKIFYKPDKETTPGDFIENDDAEACHIARFIKNCVEGSLLLIPEEKALVRPRYNDFAVLMRSTSNQIKYEKAFRNHGIPYTTQSVRTLFLESPLNDIYNLLQIIIYPDDRSAYAALLRSPLVNLSDDGIIRLLLEKKEAFREEDPSRCMTDKKELEKYFAAKNMYRFFLEKADRISLAELIHHIWFSFGYRYVVLKNPAFHGYLEYYEYIKKMATEADRRGESLAEFLDFLRPNLGKYERMSELDILKDDRDGVQIMTIHKAKGLEFPVVILANAGNMGNRQGEGRAPYYISDEFDLTFNLRRANKKYNYFYSVGMEEERRKEI